MNITIVMNTHTATAIVVIADMNTHIAMVMAADVDMTTVISIITTTRAAVVKNTTMNMEKNVVVEKNIITGMTTMCRGIRRTANVKFVTRTKNTAMCAAKV